MRKLRHLACAGAALAVAIADPPAVAYADSAFFSSASSTTPAVRAVNTASGIAVDASSMGGNTIRTEAKGVQNSTALFARQFSTGAGSSAVFGKSYPTSGQHYGVIGVNSSLTGGDAGGAGVLGTASRFGVGVLGKGFTGVKAVGIDNGLTAIGGANGDGNGVIAYGHRGVIAIDPHGTPGDGGYAFFADGQDSHFGGHIVTSQRYDATGDLAGLCTVPPGASTVTCTFTHSFADYGDTPITPMVTLTPIEASLTDVPAKYTVSASNGAGFTIKISSAATGDGITFAFHAIGVRETCIPGRDPGC
jgi:hypothetical protein